MKGNEIEKKVKILALLKRNQMSLAKTVRSSGQSRAAVRNVIIREKRIEKLIKDCAKILDGGLPYLLWPEMLSMKKDEKETQADLRKRIKYLEAKVAYYEELSKLEGVDLSVSAKKNDSGQSSLSSQGEQET